MATKAKKKGSAAKAKTKAKAQSKTPTIHFYGHWLSQPAQRVGLMLSMAKVPHAYHHVDLMQGENKKPDYVAISRFGQVPALVCKGEAMCQSNRILEFLAQTTGKFDGKSAKDKRAVREWLNWCDDWLMNIRRARGQIKFLKGKPEVIENFQSNAKTALGTLNTHLEGRSCIVGSKPTIADISAYALVALADEAGLDLKDWPEVHAWCTRMSKLPGSGHPYDVMPKESRA
jgi:glutathione S-transferase